MSVVSDNTAVWNMLKLVENGIPVGFEYFTTNPNVPVGSLPLLGGLYSRTSYADLWSWVQQQSGYLKTEKEWITLSSSNNGNVPFYSSGDGSTTFRVPALKCWVKGADSVADAGGYLKARLPNIEGEFSGVGETNDNYPATLKGAFYLNKAGQPSEGVAISQGGTKDDYFGFDASRSNSIYGSSDTVQPPSVKGLWLVKAFSCITNVGNKDLQSIITRMDEIDDNRLKVCIYTG